MKWVKLAFYEVTVNGVKGFKKAGFDFVNYDDRPGSGEFVPEPINVSDVVDADQQYDRDADADANRRLIVGFEILPGTERQVIQFDAT